MRRRGSDTKFIAKVLAQGPECDVGRLSDQSSIASYLEHSHTVLDAQVCILPQPFTAVISLVSDALI